MKLDANSVILVEHAAAVAWALEIMEMVVPDDAYSPGDVEGMGLIPSIELAPVSVHESTDDVRD
jgi:hypothetical protein